MDNAGDNDTALKEIERWLATKGVSWDASLHRLRCFGHVVALISNAFTANKPVKAERVPRAPKGTPKAAKPTWIRPVDAISKLHEVVFFAMRTPARAKEWRDCTAEASNDLLYLIKDNDTRWFSIYLLLVRAVLLKATINIFTSQNIVSNKRGDKNLSAHIMLREDWHYCSDIIAFMKPLYLCIKTLEGKPTSGRNGFIADIIPAYDYIEEHLEDQLVINSEEFRDIDTGIPTPAQEPVGLQDIMVGFEQHRIPPGKPQPGIQLRDWDLRQQLQPPLLNFLTPVLHLLGNLVLNFIVVFTRAVPTSSFAAIVAPRKVSIILRHTLCHSCGWTSRCSVVDNPVSLSSVSEPGLEFNMGEEVFVFLSSQLMGLVAVLSQPDAAD
jgi:hypothetical protein